MDIQTYMLSFFASLQALEDEQNKQRRKAKDESLPESERAEAAAAFLDLTRQIARLKDSHESFMRAFTGHGVAPPSDALIQRSKELAESLAQQLVQNLTAVALLGIVTKFVNAWASLSGAAPAAASSMTEAVASAEQHLATSSNLSFLKAHSKILTRTTKQADAEELAVFKVKGARKKASAKNIR